MLQLDFREALSSPEEKIFSMPVAVPAAQSQLAALDSYLPDVGLSRSTWANICFVGIAAIGGVVCAFYFFNGADLLRAAATWPAEYLYPRPLPTESIEATVLPNAVDQYATRDSNSPARKNDEAQDSADQNLRPAQLAQFPAPTEALASTPVTPPVVSPIVPPVFPVAPPILPVVPPSVPPIVPPVVPPTDSILGDANTVVTGTDTFAQSVYQTVTSALPKNVPTVSARSSASSARKKVASTRQKVSARAGTATSTAKSAAGATQPLTTSLQSPGVANQTMFGGGMGTVSGIGSVGSAGGVSAGSAGSAGVGGVGTPGGITGPGVGGVGGVGGLGGGLGGLGGGLGGLGGGLGGVGGVGGLGGHH